MWNFNVNGVVVAVQKNLYLLFQVYKDSQGMLRKYISLNQMDV